LNLKENPIQKLPVSIDQLTSLEELFFKKHSLSEEEKDRITELLPNTEISFE